MTQASIPRSLVLSDDPFSDNNLRNPERIDRRIRETGPLVYLEQYDVWASGRYSVVEKIFQDHETFSSAFGTGLLNIQREENWRDRSVLLDADPPEHTVSRKVISRVLSLKNIRRLQDEFQRRADELVEELASSGRFDAATDLAEAYPLSVLPDAVGMAQEGREHLLPYSQVNFQAMGPRNERYRAAVEAAGNAADYVAWQMRREALEPGGLGAQIFDAVDAGEISEYQGSMLVRAFLSAGMDTTIFGIGLAIKALIDHPQQWQDLREDPSLARNVFEETLRYTPPSPRIARTTKIPVVVDGIEIPAEQKIVLFLGAANRDPDRWDRPNEFDMHRSASGHLAFGTGIHGCVGQMLSRMEAQSVLSALARQVRSIRLIGEPREALINWLRGYDHLPVETVCN